MSYNKNDAKYAAEIFANCGIRNFKCIYGTDLLKFVDFLNNDL